MKPESWTRYLVAAAMVLLVGAVWVLGEEIKMKVEVRSDEGQEITIDVNGVSETVTLEDLADGEERTYNVGGHEVTVKRVDDRLTLVHDGEMMGHLDGDHHKRMWVEAGEDTGHHGRRVVVMKSGDGDMVDVDTDVMFIGEGDHSAHDVFILKGEDGEIDIEALKEEYGEDFEEFQ
jgi:hypothetical protein